MRRCSKSLSSARLFSATLSNGYCRHCWSYTLTSRRCIAFLFEEAPRPPQLRDRLERLFDAASTALAAYLALLPDVTVADAGLAAQLVVQTVEAITHGLVIHPRAQIAPQQYASETATMLERYLTGAPLGSQ